MAFALWIGVLVVTICGGIYRVSGVDVLRTEGVNEYDAKYHYEVSVDFVTEIRDIKKIPINCPGLEHYPGGSNINLYQRKPGNTYQLLKSFKHNEISILIDDETKFGRYLCVVSAIVNPKLNIITQIDIYDAEIKKVPTLLELNGRKTLYVPIGHFGQSIQVACPLSRSSQTDITWRRPVQFTMINQRDILRIHHVRRWHLGVYYCGENKVNETGEIIFKAVRVILHRNNYGIDKLERWSTKRMVTTKKSHKTKFICSSTKLVEWVTPEGKVMLNAFHVVSSSVAKSSIDKLLRCRSVDRVGYPLRRFKREDNFELNFGGGAVEEYKIEITPPKLTIGPEDDSGMLTCKPRSIEGDKRIEEPFFSWMFTSPNGSRPVSVDNIPGTTITFDMAKNESYLTFDPPYLKHTGTYECKYHEADADAEVEVLERAKVVVTPPFDSIVFAGGARLTCNVTTRGTPVDLNEVKWQFTPEGESTPSGLPKEAFSSADDINKLAYLDVNPVYKDQQGLYDCMYKEAKNGSTISTYGPTIEVTPPTSYKAKDTDIILTCRITNVGGQVNYNDVTWRFTPVDSTAPSSSLPTNAVTTADNTEQEANLKIDRLGSEHKGFYECMYKDATNGSNVYVYDIEVSPPEIKVRIGPSVRFFCTADDDQGSGSIVWTRQDNKAMNERELQKDGNKKAVLIVQEVERTDHNTTYVCSYKGIKKTVLLLVNLVCPLKQKQCRNGVCIDENLFCDKKLDCADGSDEEAELCDRCEPNELKCENLNGTKPSRNCFLCNWKCDGTDDCGNNFDESQCPTKNKDKCFGTHFKCDGEDLLIPRAYWCDAEKDCTYGDDEEQCATAQITYPLMTSSRDISIRAGNSLQLHCNATGRPQPCIVWRYNWGHIKDISNHTITEEFIGCGRTVSVLTIHNTTRKDAGIYTCEAINKNRVMAEDYTVYVVVDRETCKPPTFNSNAFFEEECLKCFCSGRTDICTSLNNYRLSPTPKLASSLLNDSRISDYRMTAKVLESAKVYRLWSSTRNQFYVNEEFLRSVNNDNLFIVGSFGFPSNWLLSYGLKLDYSFTVNINSKQYIDGPLFAIYGENATLYWCRTPQLNPVYPNSNSYLSLLLSEQEAWYTDDKCEGNRVNRQTMMQVLVNVKEVGIRLTYYKDQQDFSMDPIVLQHAIPSDAKGRAEVMPLIEKCSCPQGYEGLSCEKCTFNYKRTLSGRCQLICNCPKCDANGDCIECEGNRAGPRCNQCKPGFYKKTGETVSAACTPCKCPTNGGSGDQVSTECIADASKPKGYRCRCEKPGAPTNECLRTQCKDGSSEPGCEKKSLGSKCNPDGTKSVGSGDRCTCKDGYEGSTCSDCSANHFKSDGVCKKCFCSSPDIPTKCSLTPNLQYKTVKQNELVYSLGRRFLDGIYPVPDTAKYINHKEPNLMILETREIPGVLMIMMKLDNAGLTPPDRESIYTNLYGAKMTFQLQATYFEPDKVTIAEITPVVEILTQKFTRIWVPAHFDLETNLYTVYFDENFWMKWKDGEGNPVTRNTIVRSLQTAQGIGLVVSSAPDYYEQLRISNLEVEVAQEIETGVSVSGRKPPIEKCEGCGPPKDGLGRSCQGCADITMNSKVSIKQGGLPDFECAACIDPNNCTMCDAGMYKYNMITNTKFTTCQTGLTISPSAHVITVNVGETIKIPCRVQSLAKGIPIHRWVRIPSDSSQPTKVVPSVRTQLDTFGSEALFTIDKVTSKDQGLYQCQAVNVVTNITTDYYIKVNEKDPRAVVNIKVHAIKPKIPQFNITGNYTLKDKPSDYHYIWTNINGKKVKHTFKYEPTSEESDKFTANFQVQITMDNKSDNTVMFQIIGKNPSKPFYYVYKNEDIPYEPEPGDIDYSSLYLNRDSLDLKFLEAGRLSVMNPKNLPFTVRWVRADNKSLAEGMQEKLKTLTVFAGANEHTGKYFAEIIDPNGKVVRRIPADINVADVVPPRNIPIPSDTRIAVAYFPSETTCLNQRWYVIDKSTKQTIEITDKVKRKDEKSVEIDYEIRPNSVIEFSCTYVPQANLTGSSKIEKVTGDRPVPRVKYLFANKSSPYPYKVICEDTNTNYDSDVTWTSDTEQSLDTTTVNRLSYIMFDNFRASTQSGKYTCTAKNSYGTTTTTVRLPDEFPTDGQNAPLKTQMYYRNKIVGAKFVGYIPPEENITTNNGAPVKIICEQSGIPAPTTKFKWELLVDKNPIDIYEERYKRMFSISIDDSDIRYSTLNIDPAKIFPLNKNNIIICKTNDNLKMGHIVKLHLTSNYNEVLVMGLDDGELKGIQGDNKTLYGRVKNPTRQNLKFTWKFYDRNGKVINPNGTVANQAIVNENGKLELKGLNLTTSGAVSGRCVVEDSGNFFFSETFEIQVAKKSPYAPSLQYVVDTKVNPDGTNVPTKITIKNVGPNTDSKLSFEYLGNELKPGYTVVSPDGKTLTKEWDSNAPFDILTDSGYYRAVVTNDFTSSDVIIKLPEDSSIPTKPTVRIRSIDEVLEEKVIEGKRNMIHSSYQKSTFICETSGNPPPQITWHHKRQPDTTKDSFQRTEFVPVTIFNDKLFEFDLNQPTPYVSYLNVTEKLIPMTDGGLRCVASNSAGTAEEQIGFTRHSPISPKPNELYEEAKVEVVSDSQDLFVGENLTLSCKGFHRLRSKSNMEVEKEENMPESSIKSSGWIFRNVLKNEMIVDVKDLATEVVYAEKQTIHMNKFKFPIRLSVQCFLIAQNRVTSNNIPKFNIYRNTGTTKSPAAVHLHTKKNDENELQNIDRTDDLYEHKNTTYDAKQTDNDSYVYICDILDKEAYSIQWFKCYKPGKYAKYCEPSKLASDSPVLYFPQGPKLYDDFGIYECRGRNLNINRNLGYHINIQRNSVPRIRHIHSKVVVPGQSVVMKCSEEYGIPASNQITWTYSKDQMPTSSSSFGLLPGSVREENVLPNRIVELRISAEHLSQNVAGSYRCSARNSHGSSERTATLSLPSKSDLETSDPLVITWGGNAAVVGVQGDVFNYVPNDPNVDTNLTVILPKQPTEYKSKVEWLKCINDQCTLTSQDPTPGESLIIPKSEKVFGYEVSVGLWKGTNLIRQTYMLLMNKTPAKPTAVVKVTFEPVNKTTTVFCRDTTGSPKSTFEWTRHASDGSKIEFPLYTQFYVVSPRERIIVFDSSIGKNAIGAYKCTVKNSIGSDTKDFQITQ